MKTGRTLSQLAAEIERQAEAKVDYAADTRRLSMIIPGRTVPDSLEVVTREPFDSTPILRMNNGKDVDMKIGSLAHRQIGERLGIHSKYYDRMLKEAPALLTQNVNHWFNANPEKRLVRTLDGTARAFLSSGYQRIDNFPVAKVVLPVLAETEGVEVVSCEVTESRLYIKAVTHAIRAEVRSRRVGDLVEAGVMIRNSEVGLGYCEVVPFFHFLICKNGMVRNKEGLRARHVGTRLDGDETLAEILADDTKRAIDSSVLLKVRDVVRAAMSRVTFDKAIAEMQEQTTQMVKGDPAKTIEILADDFSLVDGERSSVLRHLIEGGDLSRYGLMNAITRTAEDAPDYDRATEIETMGGRILDLPAANWKRYAEAA